MDVWSFGVMLLEVTSGNLFSWLSPLNKIAFQAGRQEAPVALSRKALPSDDLWFDGLWQLLEQLLHPAPDRRPSMDLVLLSDFFTSDRFALDKNSTPIDRKFRTLNSHLDALRRSSGRLPAHTIAVRSEQTALEDMLQAFAQEELPICKAFIISWGPTSLRKPLQEVMDLALLQLSNGSGLFQQCDEAVKLHRTYLPPVWKENNQHPVSAHTRLLKQYKACGRILAKCLLEGIHVPVSFSAALHCMLVGDELLSSSADECIAMLADFDPEEAQRLRQVLAVHHGNGNELMLSVGSILGTSEATLVTDATKEGVVCCKVRA